MDTNKQKVGRLGEDLAALFLKEKGFAIIDRNYWKPWGEIDLVAQKRGELRFVEVKTVTRQFLTKADDYEPEDNIHPWKQKRLRRVIETYLLAHPKLEDLDWQVDAISVYVTPAGELLKIDWLEDVII
jgi:putative endonuclease